MNSHISSTWIVSAIHQYIAERAKTHPEVAAFVETLDALPLHSDWGGGVALRSDGELIGFRWDEPQSIKVETDPHLRFLACVAGAEQHAELASLLPTRTADDRDCASCNGTGVIPGFEGHDLKNIICYCGGTGWLPSNVPNLPGS